MKVYYNKDLNLLLKQSKHIRNLSYENLNISNIDRQKEKNFSFFLTLIRLFCIVFRQKYQNRRNKKGKNVKI